MLLQIDLKYYQLSQGALIPEDEITGTLTLQRLEEFKSTPLCPKNRYFTHGTALKRYFGLSDIQFIWVYEMFRWTIAYKEIPGLIKSYYTGVIHKGY